LDDTVPKIFNELKALSATELKKGSNSVFIAHQNKGLHGVVQASEHRWLPACKDFLVPVKAL
jgi:hypothetical protein